VVNEANVDGQRSNDFNRIPGTRLHKDLDCNNLQNLYEAVVKLSGAFQ